MTNQEAKAQAQQLLQSIKESKISPFDCENQTMFLESFDGSIQYCTEAIENAEVWEKKEFKQVLASHLEKLEKMKVWFNTMKEYNLA